MRRAGVAVLVAALAGFALLTSGASDGGGGGYRVDIMFDTAKGLLPGQLVKVAGVRSGEIVDVRLTSDFKARVQLRVDGRFAPFRSSARCTIEPEGLIGENFVQCDPGVKGRPLRGRGDQAPTLGVERTTVPVSFPELFNLATVPVRQRLSLVVSELGLGLAGHGEELNEVLRRANPTLDLVSRLGRVLERQRATVSEAVDTTDRIVGELAGRRKPLAALLPRAGRVLRRSGERAEDLRTVVRELPGLLGGTRASLERLDRLIADGTPLLRDLRDSAPDARRLVGALSAAGEAGLPALRDLDAVARTGRRVVRRVGPTVSLLRRFSERALPAGVALEPVLRDLRDRGVLENLVGGFYNVAALSARYDDESHFLPLRALFNRCTRLATTPTSGCETHYTAQRPGQRRRARRPARSDERPLRAPPEVSPGSRQDAARPVPRTGIGPVDDLLGRARPEPAPDLSALVDFLLR